MSQKMQMTVDAPRMWYINTIVDMLVEMKRLVLTTETNRRRKWWKRTRFHSLNDWKEANDDLDAPIRTVCDMVWPLCLGVVARRSKVNEILATIRHDSTFLETYVEEFKAEIVSDIDQAVYALKWCRIHEQRSCGHAESERLVTSAENSTCAVHSSRRTNSG